MQMLFFQALLMALVSAQNGSNEELDQPWTYHWYIDITVVIICLVGSGLMSGLTIGLASIDHLDLELQAQKDPNVAKSAKTIFAVINKHHWMLVTLLLCNSACLETLPIYLNKAVTEVAAILFSVVFVLLIGEIIPQALCTGPSQIKIAEAFCPVVLGLMWITSPITWPMAKALDWWQGEHKITRFNNQQLVELVNLHAKSNIDNEKSHHQMPEGIQGLDEATIRMMTGAMTLNEVPLREIYTPISKVQMLTLQTKIDEQTIRTILELGFSRIPITMSDANRIVVGILLTKTLLTVEREGKTIGELFRQGKLKLKVPVYMRQEASVFRVAQAFAQGSCHMGIVCEQAEDASSMQRYADTINTTLIAGSEMPEPTLPSDTNIKGVLGVLTLEDIIERLLQTEIEDEKDKELALARSRTDSQART